MNNYCICCGEIIPEGRQVCPQCEFDANFNDKRLCNMHINSNRKSKKSYIKCKEESSK